jgi:hypothetical protein
MNAMSKRVQWNWHDHLRDDDAQRLSALQQEANALDERKNAISAAQAEIIQRATTRARAAGDKVRPFKL